MRLNVIFSVVFLVLVAGGCAGENIFSTIGNNMSTPLTLAVDSTNARLYVVNSNNVVEYSAGSLHVVDITDPTAPARLDNGALELPNFCGPIWLDTTNGYAYMTNRLSDNDSDRIDNIFRINIDESSADFLARTDFASADDPFGISYYNGDDRLLVASEEGMLDYYDLSSDVAHSSLDLTTTLSTSVELEGAGARRIVIIGDQAVLTRAAGGLWIVDLTELATAGAYPVDYFISDLTSPREIATDGTYLFVVNVETDANQLLVLDISSLVAVADNTTAELIDKDDSGLLVSTIAVGTDPQEILLGDSLAYISNYESDTISVINIADVNNLVSVTDITVGDAPFGMAFYSPAGTPTHLFVANSGANTVSAIDLGADNAVVATYP